MSPFLSLSASPLPPLSLSLPLPLSPLSLLPSLPLPPSLSLSLSPTPSLYRRSLPCPLAPLSLPSTSPLSPTPILSPGDADVTRLEVAGRLGVDGVAVGEEATPQCDQRAGRSGHRLHRVYSRRVAIVVLMANTHRGRCGRRGGLFQIHFPEEAYWINVSRYEW